MVFEQSRFPNHDGPTIGLVCFIILIISLLNGCATEQPIAYSSKPTRVYHSQKQLKHTSKRLSKHAYRVRGKTYHPMTVAKGYSETGIASWYGAESGSKTAMGTRFSPRGLSAAHKTLPLPSKVRVTNLHNHRSIIVVVNDRGPFKGNRIIDLSQGAARKIGMDRLAKVKVDYLGRAD
jgi:rare lipoprotein A